MGPYQRTPKEVAEGSEILRFRGPFSGSDRWRFLGLSAVKGEIWDFNHLKKVGGRSSLIPVCCRMEWLVHLKGRPKPNMFLPSIRWLDWKLGFPCHQKRPFFNRRSLEKEAKHAKHKTQLWHKVF